MTTEIAIVRPEADSIEQALSHWASSFLASIAADPRYRVACDLRTSAIDRKRLPRDVATADVVMFFGHGTLTALGSPAVVMDAAEGPALGGKVVVGIACEAGASLGPDLVDLHAAGGFLGFDDQLVVIATHPSVYGAVMDASLRTLVDGSRGGADAVTVANADFRAVRAKYQAVAADPSRSPSERLDATFLWMGAHANARTIVWHAPAPAPSGSGSASGSSASGSSVSVTFDVDGVWIGDEFLPHAE